MMPGMSALEEIGPWDRRNLALALQGPVGKTYRYLRRMHNEISRERAITSTQTTALSRLTHDGPTKMSDLAAGLELSNSACTAMIEQLEQRGLVRRRGDEEDRRSTRAEVTAEGKALYQEIAAALYGRLADRINRLTLAERHMVLGAFEALARVVD
jgi:MarR family 2-MHQ and catechol resistance regulon transcriptional repressor